MQQEAIHIIHRLNLDVDVPDISSALRIHEHVLEFLYADVLPRLEEVLQRRGAGASYWNAQSVELNLLFDSEGAFHSEFAQKAAAELEAAICGLPGKTIPDVQVSNRHSKEGFKQMEIAEKRKEIFHFFLQNGRLPWHAVAKDDWLNEAELLMELQAIDTTEKVLLKQILNGNKQALHRLVAQFTPSFVFRFLALLLGSGAATNLGELDTGIAKERSGQIQWMVQLVEQLLRVGNREESLIGGGAGQEQVFKNEKAERALPNDPLSSGDEQMDKSIYVQHAGLILLHPYLFYFFKELNLLVENRFRSEAERQTAVHLLYYLATGSEQPFEYELLMEKELCAWPDDKTLDRFLVLTEQMKEEAEQLLKAVIQNWKVLKNTSAGALRESFLQRKGKYLPGTDRDRLLVEASALDVLLDFLPWNYTIIALPWQKNILYVDWVHDH